MLRVPNLLLNDFIIFAIICKPLSFQWKRRKVTYMSLQIQYNQISPFLWWFFKYIDYVVLRFRFKYYSSPSSFPSPPWNKIVCRELCFMILTTILSFLFLSLHQINIMRESKAKVFYQIYLIKIIGAGLSV